MKSIGGQKRSFSRKVSSVLRLHPLRTLRGVIQCQMLSWFGSRGRERETETVEGFLWLSIRHRTFVSERRAGGRWKEEEEWSVERSRSDENGNGNEVRDRNKGERNREGRTRNILVNLPSLNLFEEKKVAASNFILSSWHHVVPSN